MRFPMRMLVKKKIELENDAVDTRVDESQENSTEGVDRNE